MSVAKSPLCRPAVRPLIHTDKPACIDDCNLQESTDNTCSCRVICSCVCDYPCACPGYCSCPSPCNCPCGNVSISPTPEIGVAPSTDVDGVFGLAEGFRIREEGSQLLLFEVNTLRTYVLNAGAAWSLKNCMRHMPAAQIGRLAPHVLGTPSATDDVREVLGILHSLGALQRLSGPAVEHEDDLRPLHVYPDHLPRYLSAPNTVWWDVTHRCNLNCLHCYSASSPGADIADELTTREAMGLIDDLSGMGVFGIYFLGGEPLLRSDIFDLIAHARSKHIGVTLSSNGWLIGKSVAGRLASLGVSQVRVSLDGAGPSSHDWQRKRRGSFSRATSALSCLRSAGVPHVGTVSTLTRHNVHEAGEIIDLSYDRGAHATQILVIAQSGRGEYNYDNMSVSGEQAAVLRDVLRRKREEYKGRMEVYSNDGLLPGEVSDAVVRGRLVPDFMGCAAARNCCNIDSNGNIIPCLLVRNPVAGNVRQLSFGDIWRHSEVFRTWRGKSTQHTECADCHFSGVCNRECPLSESQRVISGAARRRRVTRASC